MIVKLNDKKISLHTLFNPNLLTELWGTLLFYADIVTNLKTLEKLAAADVKSEKNGLGDSLMYHHCTTVMYNGHIYIHNTTVYEKLSN